VHYKELNDSKYIAMCIYMVSVLVIPVLIINVGVTTRTNIHYGVLSGLIIFGTTMSQCIIFVPKVSRVVGAGKEGGGPAMTAYGSLDPINKKS
jgi:gamma-aminobutyric acid type B receptor